MKYDAALNVRDTIHHSQSENRALEKTRDIKHFGLVGFSTSPKKGLLS